MSFLLGLVILEGSGGRIVSLDPLGHPHVRRQMRAVGKELFELAPIEQRLLRLGRVERIGFKSFFQFWIGGDEGWYLLVGIKPSEYISRTSGQTNVVKDKLPQTDRWWKDCM